MQGEGRERAFALQQFKWSQGTVQLSVMGKSQANVSPLSDPHQPRDFWQVTFLLCASVSPPEKQISSGIDY